MKLNAFPSEEEQLVVKNYVLYKKLTRPDTTIIKVIFCVMLFIISVIVITATTLGIIFGFELNNDWDINDILLSFIVFSIVLLIGFIFTIRIALIGLIKCYQHYASEETRRRCLCMPTCSEYAILALKKYGVIIGLFKIRRRLFVTCTGNVYHKDEI